MHEIFEIVGSANPVLFLRVHFSSEALAAQVWSESLLGHSHLPSSVVSHPEKTGPSCWLPNWPPLTLLQSQPPFTTIAAKKRQNGQKHRKHDDNTTNFVAFKNVISFFWDATVSHFWISGIQAHPGKWLSQGSPCIRMTCMCFIHALLQIHAQSYHAQAHLFQLCQRREIILRLSKEWRTPSSQTNQTSGANHSTWCEWTLEEEVKTRETEVLSRICVATGNGYLG